MGALDINAKLADAKKRKPDVRTLAQQAAELAQELLMAANKEMRSDERTLLSALHRMATDEKNCRFVSDLSARVLHLSDPGEQALNLRSLLSEYGGVPSTSQKAYFINLQEIKGIKQPMDERELIADIIKENPNIKL